MSRRCLKDIMAWTCLVKCKRKWRWLHDCAEKDGIIKFCVNIGKTTIEMKQMIEEKKNAEMLPGQCLQVGEIFKMKHCTLMHNIQWHVLLFTYARIYMFYCLLTHAYLCSIRLLKTTLYTYACIFMTCPGLQKPHWLPLYWARRLGMALSLVESMPSMVVISHPSQENKGTRHYVKINARLCNGHFIWMSVRFLPKYSD